MIAELRRLLAPLLARRMPAAQRRELADALSELAAQQAALADADQRIGHQVRRAALDTAPRTGGRPKGSGARFLRWDAPTGTGKQDRRSGMLHIGRALWQELGEPARFDVQRIGAALVLRPCGEGQGWAVGRPPNGMPRLNIGEEAADTLRLAEGRYPAEIKDGAIVASWS
jgi:hypothetical protein